MTVAEWEMLSEYGTEQIGISAEIAIADLSNVNVNSSYRKRGRVELIEHIKPAVSGLIVKLPKPTYHAAEGQNSIDFLLTGNKTLSVKSNMQELGKVAPQLLGQPTDRTFWAKMPHLVPKGINVQNLSYQDSARLFKKAAQDNIVELLGEYWDLLFHCDYMIWVYDVLGKTGLLSNQARAVLLERTNSPAWEESKISFTKNLATWNESCTVKYDQVTIGEFQVHNHRNCFKFRFDGRGLVACGLI